MILTYVHLLYCTPGGTFVPYSQPTHTDVSYISFYTIHITQVHHNYIVCLSLPILKCAKKKVFLFSLSSSACQPYFVFTKIRHVVGCLKVRNINYQLQENAIEIISLPCFLLYILMHAQ